jgi:hypothetical protein
MNEIKVVFLAANPTGTDRLRLDKEIRAITEKIRASAHRDLLVLEPVLAARPDDLLQALNEHKPHVVHFAGHGSIFGQIVLEGNYGQPKPVTPQAIRTLFTTLKDNIRIVILSACYSKAQARAITEVIDCAVGMSNTIEDQAAIVFAASFYRAIGFGRSVQKAFDQGKTALLLEGIPGADVPELLVRDGVDPSQIFLISCVGETSSPPVIYLMDSTLDELVYNERRRQIGGTNADDLIEILDELPVELCKEATHLEWNREEALFRKHPDLIVIHASAFYDSTNVQDSERKFDSFLRYMADTPTKFLIYSRSPAFCDEDGVREQYEDNYRLPGRVNVLRVEREWDGVTARKLRTKVKSMLGLP